MSALDTLKTFSVDNIPDLDVAVLGALELFEGVELPSTTVPFHRPLVVGSGNAELVGRILFRGSDAVFASESDFEEALARVPEIDGAVVISASGGKHSVAIAERLKERGVQSVLFTNHEHAPAAEFFKPENVRVFPKNREPYTYNTSTYLGMILSDTGESAKDIRLFINQKLSDFTPETFADHNAFIFILPPQFSDLRGMLRTKFDELFGPKIVGRFFTTEEMKHAKTVVTDEKELTISIGEAGGDLSIPLPSSAGYGASLAVTYYLIGQIQRSKPPYFKDNIVRYCLTAGAAFNTTIEPIVE